MKKLLVHSIRVAASAIVGATVLSIAAPVARAQEQVVVQIGSGDFAAAMTKAFVEPFEKETGIRVKTVPEFMNPAKLKLMVENDNVEIDVVLMAWLHAISANQAGFLEQIDYGIYDKDELAALDGKARQPYGVGAYYYSQVLGYDTTKISADNAPGSWKDFWNVEKYPGDRSFKSGVQGEGAYEEALLADGVPADKLYPLDIDRAFASLDRIKPHIKKWWRFGAEGQQIFADGAVALGAIYNGRATNLRDKGMPIDTHWNEGKLLLDLYLIPKGARNVANAQKFIEFATRGEHQAVLSTIMHYGPTNKKAFDHIDEEAAKLLPTSPDNVKLQFLRNDEWYAEKNAEGKTNVEILIERWNRFAVE